jgi:hypothetical protein
MLAGSERAEAQAGEQVGREQLEAADARLAGRLDPETRRAVIASIDSYLAAGLPPELTSRLVSRALQAAAGSAAPELILSSIRDHGRRLVAAHDALPNAGAADVDAGAEALRAGVSLATLRALRQLRPRSSLAVPLIVLVDLVVQGVPADTAAELILAVAEKQASDAQYNNLRLQVASDIGAGTLPIVAAETRTRGVLGAGVGAASAATMGADAANGPQRGGTSTSGRPPGGTPPPP